MKKVFNWENLPSVAACRWCMIRIQLDLSRLGLILVAYGRRLLTRFMVVKRVECKIWISTLLLTIRYNKKYYDSKLVCRMFYSHHIESLTLRYTVFYNELIDAYCVCV